MDPKANLKEQLALARKINAAWEDCNDDGELEPGQAAHVAGWADELADLVLALDEWQRKGGFSPYV